MKDLRDVIDGAINSSQVDELVTQQSADALIDEILSALEEAYETPQEMIDRYFAIASQVTLAEYFKVIVAQDKEKPFGRWYYQITFQRIDVITGVWGPGYGGKAYLSPHASDNELVQTIFGLYKGVWEHEARESFQWNDRRVFGPHIATQALWDVAKRVDTRNAKHVDDTPTAEEADEAELAALRRRLSTPAKQTFEIRDKVAWKDANINTDIVYGHVVGFDVDRQEVQVSWADGSGPTWHRMESMQKIG